METALPGDVAFIRAWKADEVGNVVFRYASQNFSTVMAKNAKVTIVEVRQCGVQTPLSELTTLQAEEIVPAGKLSPNAIHVPGIYVDRVVKATVPKHIEIYTLASTGAKETQLSPEKAAALALRQRIARRAAKEFKDGYYANLGIGIPTLIPEYLQPGVKVWWQSENGILGMGPYPTEKQLDPSVIHSRYTRGSADNHQLQRLDQRRERNRHLDSWGIRVRYVSISCRGSTFPMILSQTRVNHSP